jgi:hypothetical protein
MVFFRGGGAMRNFVILTGLISILGAICVLRIEYDQGCDRREAAMKAAIALELKRLDDAGWARIRMEEASDAEALSRAWGRAHDQLRVIEERRSLVPYTSTTWSAPIRPYGGGYDNDSRFPQGGGYSIGTAIPGVR